MLKQLQQQRFYNEKVMMTIFALLGKPTSMLDLGCGDGTMVKMAKGLGIGAVGVDILDTADVVHDLTTPLELGEKTFDLILCIEVAEHLPKSAASTLMWSIGRYAHPNSRLVFSAAMPGQGGNNHLNEQPPRYWRSMLYEIGKWSYRDDLTSKLQLLLSHTAGPEAMWLVPNVQVF